MTEISANSPVSDPNSISPRLILASASPRRRELLALLGLPFTVETSRYEEPPPPTYPIRLADFVVQLASGKASEVAARLEGDGLVIGADTLVSLSLNDTGVPLGKPADVNEAQSMLRGLAGQPHVVHTGVALVRVTSGRAASPVTTSVRTVVRFRDLSDMMIADYVATGEPMDKAGAYGAQGYAAPFIESFEGDFYNVVGLPLCALGRLLEQEGVAWWRHRSAMPPVIG